MTYTQAAVERPMKVHEVLMQALNGRQPWIHVAEVLGVSAHGAAAALAVREGRRGHLTGVLVG